MNSSAKIFRAQWEKKPSDLLKVAYQYNEKGRSEEELAAIREILLERGEFTADLEDINPAKREEIRIERNKGVSPSTPIPVIIGIFLTGIFLGALGYHYLAKSSRNTELAQTIAQTFLVQFIPNEAIEVLALAKIADNPIHLKPESLKMYLCIFMKSKVQRMEELHKNLGRTVQLKENPELYSHYQRLESDINEAAIQLERIGCSRKNAE